MTVDFNHSKVMEMYEKKRRKFLIMTGEQGANLAALKSRVDTGASQSAKQYRLVDKQTVLIEAPLEYDIYLERRYGIMAKVEDELIPHMERYEKAVFG